MKNLFKYRFKCLIRNKSLLFWTLAFPLVLTTLFSVALPNLNDLSSFEIIDIAVVKNEAFEKNVALQQVLEGTEKELFHIQYISYEEASKSLEDNKELIIVEDGKQLQIHVAETGINQTIVQSFFNEYVQKSSMIEKMMMQSASPQQVQALFTDTHSYIKEIKNENSNITSVSFFTILAMNALFGGYWAIESAYVLQANLSDKAARIGVTPTHKAKALFVDMVIACGIQLTFLIIVLNYMQFIIKVDFGPNISFIYLLLGIATFAGNAFGTFIGCLSKLDMNFKSGILTTLTLMLSFFSGMMMVQMKYLVQSYAPWFAAINPVNMVTDGLYALYYYGVGERYVINLASLVIFTVIFYVASYFMLRKRQYDRLGV